MTQWLPFVGIALAVCLGTTAVYFWRRSLFLKGLVIEAAARVDVSKKQIHYLEENLNRASDKQANLREGAQKLEYALDETRSKLSLAQQQLEDQDHAWRSRADNNEKQLDHFKEQATVLLSQLTEADRERKEAQVALERLKLEMQTQLDQVRDGAQSKLREQTAAAKRQASDEQRRMHQEIDRLTREASATKAAASAVDPEELLNARRRAVHYEKLYAGMKSLREMSDDRSRNWETALRQFSVFILENYERLTGQNPGAQTRKVDGEGPIGPLVGEALEIVGGQLVPNDGIDIEAIAKKVMDEPVNF